MTVALLVITHNRLGTELLQTATSMLGVCPLPADAISVTHDRDPDALLEDARRRAKALDKGDGILVLTDMFGSTPSNIANRLLDRGRTMVVAGVNLPMLVRVLNYPRLSLPELAEKALSGGRDGVLLCTSHAELT
jgi:PTS system mannose-specific IIA component